MNILTRDQILAASDLKSEAVEVPEWGGTVYVRAMSGTERDAWEVSMLEVHENGKGLKARPVLTDLRAKLCARCIADEAGNRLFTDADVEVLGQKSAAALDRVYGVAQRLNAIGEKDIEELAGN